MKLLKVLGLVVAIFAGLITAFFISVVALAFFMSDASGKGAPPAGEDGVATAQELLVRAEKLESSGKVDQALGIYGRVVTEHAGTEQATVASEAAKRLQREQAEAKKAAAASKVAAWKKLEPTLHKRVDEMEGITWYSAPSMSKEYKTAVEAYIGEKGGSVWLRCKARYHGDEWVFPYKFFVVADGERFDVPMDPLAWSRDNTSDSVWEIADLPGADHLDMLRAVAKAEKAAIRFQGKDHISDHVISTREKRAIALVLDAFEARRGMDHK